ncbi:hypothetical protein [Actinomadura parmotrematis]|uniref:DUF3040 domain-containing protein n=1 Tax=Actinomadura parmotrematis TaxID=2864039 RepID=A0ABS7FN47_9ACTN|nr:hypothetical protein [Actinomadura parmotrematis]MBW8480983.1 hypothetical protein [Actinomadura parmotrematis]
MKPSPVPSDRQARAAWRALPRATRREMLAAEEPWPDRDAAGAGVAYARMMLARSPRRHSLIPAAATLAIVVVGTLVVQLTGGGSEMARLAPVLLACAVLVWSRNRLSAYLHALDRLARLNAAPAKAPAEPV